MAGGNRKTAKKYARALFDLCPPQDLDAVGAAVGELSDTLQSSRELRHILRNPSFELKARLAVLREICARIRPGDGTLANFAELLLRNDRIAALPQAVLAFQAMIAEYRKLLTLEVVSACDLSAGERDAFTDRIRADIGPLVSVHWYINPDIIGGMMVRAGDRVLDGSVRGALERLRSEMLSA